MNAIANDVTVSLCRFCTGQHLPEDCPLDGLEREIHDVTRRIEREAKINGVEHVRKGKTLATVRTLRRLGIRLHRSYENACNREQSPNEIRTERQIEGRVMALCHEIGVRVEFQGDPRGAPLQIKSSRENNNSFGGDRIIIPTAAKREYRR